MRAHQVLTLVTLLVVASPAGGQEAAGSAVTLKTGRLSVSAHQAPLQELLAEIGRLGGIQISADGPPSRIVGERITVAFEGVTVEDALARLLRDKNYVLIYSSRGLAEIQIYSKPTPNFSPLLQAALAPPRQPALSETTVISPGQPASPPVTGLPPRQAGLPQSTVVPPSQPPVGNKTTTTPVPRTASAPKSKPRPPRPPADRVFGVPPATVAPPGQPEVSTAAAVPLRQPALSETTVISPGQPERPPVTGFLPRQAERPQPTVVPPSQPAVGNKTADPPAPRTASVPESTPRRPRANSVEPPREPGRTPSDQEPMRRFLRSLSPADLGGKE